MVRWTPKGNIASKILANALAHIDSNNVYERRDRRFPFLFLDGHQSGFEIPFLKYVTGNELEWQVADSKEQNGSYKIALARSKKEFWNKKLSLFIDPPNLMNTDIVPLANIAWNASFI